MGEEEDKVLSSITITEDERKVYTSVLEKFNALFEVRRNVIFEWTKFNRRDQAAGESGAVYHQLLHPCEHGVLKEDMLHDHIVVEIRDKELSKKLQLDLEKVKMKACQKELCSNIGKSAKAAARR